MAKQKTFYLGIEGGATKSTALLVDEKGGIVMEAKGQALNYQAVGKKLFEKNLAELVRPVLNKTKGEKLKTVLGIAGLNTKADETYYKKAAKAILPSGTIFQAVNDANIALEAKCYGVSNKILSISGTGASVYGESGSRSAKSIGWDFIFGDEGGSYDVGLKTLKAVTKSWDGRTKKTLLESLVLKKAGVKKMEDLQLQVYSMHRDNPSGLKHFIASFSSLVDKAIIKNDWAAIKIRDGAVQDLTDGICAVASRLNFTNKSFCLGLVGSGWKMPKLEEQVKKNVQRNFPKVQFSKNKDLSGVYGAVLMAKKL
jgi:N-acetylglucosamine kinase-like BadF-type ATPase